MQFLISVKVNIARKVSFVSVDAAFLFVAFDHYMTSYLWYRVKYTFYSYKFYTEIENGIDKHSSF